MHGSDEIEELVGRERMLAVMAVCSCMGTVSSPADRQANASQQGWPADVRFWPILLKNSVRCRVRRRTENSTSQNGPGDAIVVWLRGRVPPKTPLKIIRASFSTE
jgi:hypothetical protein